MIAYGIGDIAHSFEADNCGSIDLQRRKCLPLRMQVGFVLRKCAPCGCVDEIRTSS